VTLKSGDFGHQIEMSESDWQAAADTAETADEER